MRQAGAELTVSAGPADFAAAVFESIDLRERVDLWNAEAMSGNATPLMVADYRGIAALAVEFGDSCNSATKKTCGDFFGKGVATGVTPPVAFIGAAVLQQTSGPSFQSNACCTRSVSGCNWFEDLFTVRLSIERELFLMRNHMARAHKAPVRIKLT